MKLWHISQNHNTRYDSYDSAVVAALSEDAARYMHPEGAWELCDEFVWVPYEMVSRLVTARLIGEAVEGTSAGVICASFNAG